MIAAIQTVHNRATELADTITSAVSSGLCDGGLEVYMDGQRRGPYGGFLGMARLLVATYPHEDWYLTLQDDIRLTRGLDRVLFHDLPSDGVVSLFTPAHAYGQRRAAGWWEVAKYRGSYGAQAYLWPGLLLRSFMIDPPQPERRVEADHWVLMWCKREEVPYYHHNPSFVMHAGAGTTTQDLVRGSQPCRQCAQWLVDAKIGSVAVFK